jgi:hypothetical protein
VRGGERIKHRRKRKDRDTQQGYYITSKDCYNNGGRFGCTPNHKTLTDQEEEEGEETLSGMPVHTKKWQPLTMASLLSFYSTRREVV